MTSKKKASWKPKNSINGMRYNGVATLLTFAECEGIVIARNMRDLRKLSRGFYLCDFDPKKAKRVTVAKAK